MKQLTVFKAPAAPDDKFEITISDEAVQARRSLLEQEKAWSLDGIKTDEERDKVIAVSQEIDSHLKNVDGDRKKYGDPFRKVMEAINESARLHRLALEDAKKRLDRQSGAYEEQREAKLAAIQREADRKAQEARDELQRKANEAAAALADQELSSAPPELTLEAELDAENAEEQLRIKNRLAEDERIRLAEVSRSTAATGGAKRYEVNIKVTDMKLLQEKHPDCVTITPNLVQIKFLEARGVQIHGVEITKTPVYGARAKR